MADTSPLAALSPFHGHALPETRGGATLAEFAPGAIVSVMPFRGRREAVAAALGLDLPGPNRTAAAGDRRVLWSGREAWTLIGPEGLFGEVEPRLRGLAAVAEQSDSHAGLVLSGPDARAVLARLCPLDLHAAAFADGETARTDVAHMMAQLTRAGESFEILVLRSFAATLLHEVEAAMASVAAQRAG